MRKIIFLTVLLFSLFLTLPAKTQETPSQTQNLVGGVASQLGVASGQTGLSRSDPRQIAVVIIKVLLGLLGTIFFAQVVYAGYMWMTAGGDSKKVETAQKYIKNGVIGLVIILLSYGIVLLVTVYVIRGTSGDYINPYTLPPSYPRF